MGTSRWLVVCVVACVAAGACSHTSTSSHAPVTSATSPKPPAAAANACNGPLRATDVGVTPTAIVVEVMADVGSPLAPGVGQGALDAMNAFAARVNAHGGLACRQLKVRTWDSKLDPAESKNGQIDACANAFAMVGNDAGLNTDISTLSSCADGVSGVSGLPEVAGFSSEDSQCGPTLFAAPPLDRACPVPKGDNTYTEQVGYMKWQLQQDPGLHGLYLIEGDIPALTVGEVPLISAYQQAGMVWDAISKVSVAETQTGYTPRVQIARAKQSTYVFDGGIDTSLILMRREAAAQGETSVKVWGCTINCYAKSFIEQGGKEVEGTYVWLNFLPFEEASYNTDETAFVNGVGLARADLAGAYAWQAADAFEQTVNAVVAKDGPNGLTRTSLVAALRNITNFSANGWLGPHALSGPPSNTPCFVVVQVQHGTFVRVYPTTPGTMDCNAANLGTVTVDAAAVAATLK
jgi:Periplasmic binding protein